MNYRCKFDFVRLLALSGTHILQQQVRFNFVSIITKQAYFNLQETSYFNTLQAWKIDKKEGTTHSISEDNGNEPESLPF